MNLDYRDLIRSGLGTKSFIAPGSIWFQPKMMKIDNQFGRVMFVRNYPNFLNDRLIKSLVDVGIELVINVLARPYDVGESLKKINNAEAAIKMMVFHRNLLLVGLLRNLLKKPKFGSLKYRIMTKKFIQAFSQSSLKRIAKKS